MENVSMQDVSTVENEVIELHNDDMKANEANHEVAAPVESLNDEEVKNPDDNRERQLDERENNLLKREQELEYRILEMYAKQELSNHGMPGNLAKVSLGKTEAETLSNIKELKIAFDEAIQNAVNERMKGKTPTTGISLSSVSQSDIKEKMSNIINGGKL